MQEKSVNGMTVGSIAEGECGGHVSSQYMQERSAESIAVGSMCKSGVQKV